MGAIGSSDLVAELQRRITNLDSGTALAALNRAYRWIARQASFQFLTASKATITVGTTTAATVTYSGTCDVVQGYSNVVWRSGNLFDATGTWSVLFGPVPYSQSGHTGLTITIGGVDYQCYIVDTTTSMIILGTWSLASGTYSWSLSVTSTSNSNGPSDLDPGKAKVVINPDGTPVSHVPLSEFWSSSNYRLPSTTSYDTYTIVSDNTVSPPTHQFLFFPSFSGSVTLYYHKLITDLVGSNDKTCLPKDFDDLLVDLAEAEERRIYDVGDTWQLLMARAQDQLKVLIDGYKSQTQEPGPEAESAAKVQEETSIGRA